MKKLFLLTALILTATLSGQDFSFEKKQMQAVNVTAVVEKVNGKKALRVERDLSKLPFVFEQMNATTDEPTFVKLVEKDFSNGIIEVAVLSKLQEPLLFKEARGFIGVAYHINDDNSAFECIYIRPTNGRSDNQFRRNHSVQYYAYPDYKWAKLRSPEYKGIYETYADMGLNEWIKLRIEVKEGKPTLYINNAKYPSFVVNNTLGKNQNGAIGLFVDIGTIGYFRDIKVIHK